MNNTKTLVLAFAQKKYGSGPDVLKSGDVITITADGYEDLTFKLVINTDGSASVEENDGKGDPLELHVKIEGSFEAAIVGQKNYDGVSSASVGGASSNKNSAVTVYGALVQKNAEPSDSDWEELDHQSQISLNGSKCSVSIVPDTANGTKTDADSGMKGVYMTLSSDLTLNGTPKDAGSYLISIHVEDNQGRTADSNELPFRIYTGEETLADQIKNLKQYSNGLYAWDIMEPWAIKNFGSNVEGQNESVRVPKDLEVWYGSHQSGTYGYLGYDQEWEKVEAGEIPQTLYIPNGCNLTLVNMEILSSVRIVVENGGKLTLRDSGVQGIIDVQGGGTFSMNYNDFGGGEFLTGASINGQLRLADGAILENAAIYSHINYLANGDLVDRTSHEPVVTATGNVTVKGQVFIKGDAGGSKIGQAGLRVTDGTLTLADGATLVVYGGEGNVVNTKGGTAVQLENGTITGSTNLSENEIQRAMADAAAYEAEDSRRKERLELHNQAEVLAYKVDEALSKCKKELDKDEKNRVKADLANLRRCLRKDKPEKMNETEEAALRQAKSQLEASANHLMVLYTSQTEQDASGNDTAGSV